MEKAYDKMRWSFIKEVLKEANFTNNLVKFIMECISTTSFNIIWNGGKIEDFKLSRGIKQGDLMSPYIFVLCMEKLSHLIEDVVQNGNWKPMKARSKGLQISHMMFIRNLILFREENDLQSFKLKW